MKNNLSPKMIMDFKTEDTIYIRQKANGNNEGH